MCAHVCVRVIGVDACVRACLCAQCCKYGSRFAKTSLGKCLTVQCFESYTACFSLEAIPLTQLKYF